MSYVRQRRDEFADTSQKQVCGQFRSQRRRQESTMHAHVHELKHSDLQRLYKLKYSMLVYR